MASQEPRHPFDLKKCFARCLELGCRRASRTDRHRSHLRVRRGLRAQLLKSRDVVLNTSIRPAQVPLRLTPAVVAVELLPLTRSYQANKLLIAARIAALDQFATLICTGRIERKDHGVLLAICGQPRSPLPAFMRAITSQCKHIAAGQRRPGALRPRGFAS